MKPGAPCPRERWVKAVCADPAIIDDRLLTLTLLALHGKNDGERVLLSVPMLANATGWSRAKARVRLKAARDSGHITEVARGAGGPPGKGRATIYRLTLPETALAGNGGNSAVSAETALSQGADCATSPVGNQRPSCSSLSEKNLPEGGPTVPPLRPNGRRADLQPSKAELLAIMDDESDDLDERMIAWVYRNVSDRDEPAKQEQTLSLLLSTGWTYDVETWGWPKGRDAAEVLVATAFYQAAVDDLGGTPEAKAEAAAAYTVLACRRAASDAGNYFDNSRWHGWAALLVGADRYEPKSPETIVEKLKATAPTKCGGPLQSGGTALRNEIRRCANPDAGDAPPPTASPVPPSTPTVAAAAPPASASSSSSSWPDVAPASWPFFDPDRIYPCPAPEEAP